jgi:hypothetical protein
LHLCIWIEKKLWTLIKSFLISGYTVDILRQNWPQRSPDFSISNFDVWGQKYLYKKNGPLSRRKCSNSPYFYTSIRKRTRYRSQISSNSSNVHCTLDCTRQDLVYGNSLAVCKTSLIFQITIASLLSTIGYTFMSHFWLGMTPGYKVMKHPVFVPIQTRLSPSFWEPKNTTVLVRALKREQKVKEQEIKGERGWDGEENKKFWEELVAYFPYILHGSHIKRRLQQIFRCRGNVFNEPLPGNDRGIHSPRFSFDMTRTALKATPPTIILLLRVLVATGMCLPSRCLETIRVDTQTDTQTDERDLWSTPLR